MSHGHPRSLAEWLAATIIAIFLIPVTYYVVERFAANRRQRAARHARSREHRDSGPAIALNTVRSDQLRIARGVFQSWPEITINSHYCAWIHG